MGNGTTTIRLMQTRSLEHLWNQQRRQPELTLHEFIEMLKVKPVMLYFFRRDSDQSSGCPQQRLIIRVNDHISVELRCRTFIYNCRDGGCVELFAIGGICEIVTPCLDGVTVLVEMVVITIKIYPVFHFSNFFFSSASLSLLIFKE